MENNEENKVKEAKPTNKKKTILIVVGIVLAILLILLASIFVFYRSKVDVLDKYEDKFQFVVSEIDDTKKYSQDDFVHYDKDKDPNNLVISIPELYILNDVVNVKKIANDLSNSYGVNINRIGLENNEEDVNAFNYYADVSYKDLLSTVVRGVITYEITDDNYIKLYSKDINIGDVPKSLYEKYVELPIDTQVAEVDAGKIEIFNDDKFDLKSISQLKVNGENLECKYDFTNNLNRIEALIYGFTDVFNENQLEKVQEGLADLFGN